MNLAIDAREACKTQRTGKGQWAYGFINELLQRDFNITLYTDRPLPKNWQGAKHQTLPSGLRFHLAAAALKPELYLSPTSYLVPALWGKKIPCITVVHDLIAWRGELHNKKATLIERSTLKPAAFKSAKIACVSQSTKADLLERYPTLEKSKIEVVYAGPSQTDPPLAQGGSSIICPATLCPRKNQRRLLQAYAQLSDELRAAHPLILTGSPGWQYQEILDLVEATPGAIWRGYINEAEYNQLLNQSYLLALPSLYEGFGLQILDALQRGVPVLTSHQGSLAEVVGEAGIVVDPLSVSSIKAGLMAALKNTQLCQQLRERGPGQAAEFSWRRTVNLFSESVYQ